MFLMPMDEIKNKVTGEERRVNSAHYADFSTGVKRQRISICGMEGTHLSEDWEFIHRCEYKPYNGGIKRCDCGEVYTTMADLMKNPSEATH